MGVVSLQGSLLLLAFFFYTVLTAPVIEENSALLGPDQIAEGKDGCYYNYEHYDEGDRILTNEPCLNCTCHNRMLMCYLRVCPFTKAIGQDCKIEKKPDQCCPIITCPQVPVTLLTSSTTEMSSISSAVGRPDNYGCVLDDNTFYADGAQVPSDPRKPCELCYCIRNQTACVMQECTLNVEGCKPVYQEGVCCPVRYDCDYDDVLTTPGPTIGLITTPGGPNECQVNDSIFRDGEMIDNMTENPCEHCYCMRGEVVCAVQECGQPLENTECTPLPAEPGQCCPNTYQCPNGTVPAQALHANAKPDGDSLSVTEKPHDEDKSIEEIEKHDEATSAEGIETSAETIEQQPEKQDSTSSESTDASNEDSKIQAEIEIITTPVPHDLSEASTQAVEQESEALQVATAEPSSPVAEENHVKETHDAEATTIPGHYTEISVENVEMNTSPPEMNSPEVTQEETAAPENDGKETSEKIAQEPTTQPPVEHSEDPSSPESPEAVAAGADEGSLQETAAPEADQEMTQAHDEKPSEITGNEIPETTPAPISSTTTTTEAEPEELPRIPGEGSCLHKGITYAPNTEVMSTDPCKRCRCVNSIVTCKELECAEPPFSQNSNCAPMPPADGACCPTYLCEQTPSQEPEAENHMSIDKIDMVVPDEDEVPEEDAIPTTLATITEQENIPSMVGIPENLVPGTDEITINQDVPAPETPEVTHEEEPHQESQPESPAVESEVHEVDEAIAATTPTVKDSNDLGEKLEGQHIPAHDSIEDTPAEAEASQEPLAATTAVPLESDSNVDAIVDAGLSANVEGERHLEEAHGQANANEETAPSTDAPQEPTEVQPPSKSSESSGTNEGSAPEQANTESEAEASAAPETILPSQETHDTAATNDKIEESDSETGSTAASVPEHIPLGEQVETIDNEQTHEETASSEPSVNEEHTPEQISTEGPSSNAEQDSVPSESTHESESGNLPTADDKENDLTGSNEDSQPVTTESPKVSAELSPSNEVEHSETVHSTEGPAAAEETPELQPVVTAGPPVLFPDIGHQGAPIQVPGPAGISNEPIEFDGQRIGETESPEEQQPSVTEKTQIIEDSSTSSGDNNGSIKDESAPTTEGPSVANESTVENGSESPIEEANANESSQTSQSANIEDGNEITQPEQPPAHEVETSLEEDGKTSESEPSPATEQSQAAPEATPEIAEPSNAGIDNSESSQPVPGEGTTQSSERLEEGPAPGSDDTPDVPIVTHGDLPVPSESSPHPIDNVVQLDPEPEHEKTPEANQVEHAAETIPHLPEGSNEQPGEADSQQEQVAVTQVPESEEVVTHVDVDRPQPSLESANQIIDSEAHKENEESHPSISEEQASEATPELEKVPSSEDQGETAATPEEAGVVAPETELDHPAHEELPQTSEPEQPALTVPEVPEHTVPEEPPVESDIVQESHPEETPAEEHHEEVPIEHLPEQTIPESAPEEPSLEQTETEKEKLAEEQTPEHVPTEVSHTEEISGPQVHDTLPEQEQQPEHIPAEEHVEQEQPTQPENSPDAAQEEHSEVESQPAETTPLPEQQAPQEPQPAEADVASTSVDSETPVSSDVADKEIIVPGEAVEGQQAGEGQETVPTATLEDSSPAVPSDTDHLELQSETTPSSVVEQASEVSVGQEQSSVSPSGSDNAPVQQASIEENQSIAGDKAESESASEQVGEATPEEPTIPSAKPTDSESQLTAGEVEPSGLGPITAPEELAGETGPSAPSAPETAPSAPETAPEEPSAPESQPSSPGHDEIPLTLPEASAQPPQVEVSSHEESDKLPSPVASSSPLSEYPSGSSAPPVELPSTEGPIMPGLQNWSQKPYHPSDHHSTSEQQPHLPDDSHYPSPPYDTDYEDEDSVSYGPGTCRYGGKVYLSAQQIPRDDPCDFCFCFRSDIICLQQSCPPPIKGCYQETIKGFCCPRYECHVSMATVVNITTTSTTTTTTVPPHFLSHLYNGSARKAGCQVKGVAYKVGDRIEETSGPCLDCRCGADGQMKCDPTVCGPQESLLRQVMAGAVSKRRRR